MVCIETINYLIKDCKKHNFTLEKTKEYFRKQYNVNIRIRHIQRIN